jgi:hypothetical protein
MQNSLSLSNMPEVLDVVHIQEFLSIGRKQAYDLANSGQFHVVRIGNRIKISKQVFSLWWHGELISKED